MKEIREEEEQYYFKPKINYIPVNLHLDELFLKHKPYGFKSFDKDYCAVLLSKLYTVPVRNKEIRENVSKNGGFIPLSAKLLDDEKRNYKQYVNLLSDAGVLEINNSYSTSSHKCKEYRFTPAYRDQPVSRYINYPYGESVTNSTGTMASFIKTPIYHSDTAKQLIENLTDLKVTETAFAALRGALDKSEINIQTYNYTFVSLDKIFKRDFFAGQDDYGRIHTNLTNLKKEYRNFITTTKDESLLSIDIVNSQPFFSLTLLRSSFWEKDFSNNLISIQDIETKTSLILQQQEIKQELIMFCKSVEDNDDVKLYRELVLNGILYEFIQGKLIDEGLICESRKDAKKVLFNVLFDKKLHLETSRKANIFKKIFPSIYGLFMIIKNTDYKILACLLQSIESHVIIEEVVKGLWKSNPQTNIFTIHDSVVIPINRAITMKWDMIHSIKEKIGYKPSILCEVLKP